jgi:hypothetical protein
MKKNWIKIDNNWVDSPKAEKAGFPKAFMRFSGTLMLERGPTSYRSHLERTLLTPSFFPLTLLPNWVTIFSGILLWALGASCAMNRSILSVGALGYL